MKASHAGGIYGINVADIGGTQHLVCIDYHSCCIFERKLQNLQSNDIIDALKSIFCDVAAPSKIISDNAKYFISEEFENFTMDCSIQPVTSSPTFPHRNAHAEKAVGIIK